MVFASRSNRVLRFGDATSAEFSTLMATVRSSRVSRASYTSPMPPAPSGATISYGPSRVARESPISYLKVPGLYPNIRLDLRRKPSKSDWASHEQLLRNLVREGLPTIRKVESGTYNVRGRDHLPRITP